MEKLIPALSDKSIVLIENDHDTVEVVSYVIERLGCQVILADEMHVADVVKTYKPSLVIIEYWLNWSWGTDICLALKSNDETANIPVILYSTLNVKERALECKADTFISKPFDIDEVEQTIERLLTSR